MSDDASGLGEVSFAQVSKAVGPISSKVRIAVGMQLVGAVRSKDQAFVHGGPQVFANAFDSKSMGLLGIDGTFCTLVDSTGNVWSSVLSKEVQFSND